MIVKARTNSIDDLPDEVQEFALPTQDDGITLDVTIGGYYPVYGKQIVDNNEWYLLHTDTENVDSFWWMPATLYDVYDNVQPQGWKEIEAGIFTYDTLKDWRIYEGLEDGDSDAIDKFNHQVSLDDTFPSSNLISSLNADSIKAS